MISLHTLTNTGSPMEQENLIRGSNGYQPLRRDIRE